MNERANAYLHSYLMNEMRHETDSRENDGYVLNGSIRLFEATHEELYKDYVLQSLHQIVRDDGTIPSFSCQPYRLDHLNPGKALYFALRETGESKYGKAIDLQMKCLSGHPRCACGNFWHSENDPNQIWLDDLFMALPLYMAYEKTFDSYGQLGDITSQFQNVRKFMFDEAKGLYYHRYDESRQQPWCDSRTGISGNFSLPGTGLYFLALADCIELCDEQLYEHYRFYVDLLREAVKRILPYQDPETHLFYQTVHLPELNGNDLETSGSAMIAAAILKGVRLHVLNDTYKKQGLMIFDGILEHALKEEKGETHLLPCCRADESAGVYAEHDLPEDICSDDSRVVGAFMMAYAEEIMARRQICI